jgi:hypothetical protein
LTSCAKASSFEVLVNADKISLIAKTDDESLTLDLDADEIELHLEGESLITHITPAHFLSLMSTTSAKTVFSVKGSVASVVETEWTESGLKLRGWIAPRT